MIASSPRSAGAFRSATTSGSTSATAGRRRSRNAPPSSSRPRRARRNAHLRRVAGALEPPRERASRPRHRPRRPGRDPAAPGCGCTDRPHRRVQARRGGAAARGPVRRRRPRLSARRRRGEGARHQRRGARQASRDPARPAGARMRDLDRRAGRRGRGLLAGARGGEPGFHARRHRCRRSGDDDLHLGHDRSGRRARCTRHRVLLGHLPGVEMPHEFLPQPGDRLWTPADWAWAGGLLNVLLPGLALRRAGGGAKDSRSSIPRRPSA